MHCFMAYLIAFYLSTSIVEAGMLSSIKNWCTKYLVQEDPWPFAELSNEELAFQYRLTKDPKAGKEIVHRMRNRLMPFSVEFSYLFEGAE